MRTLLLALLIAFFPTAVHAQGKAKNVVLIIADDLGMQLGCYGDPAIQSPNIDGLAKKGVRFAKAYASVSSCSPSRASVLSGLYTHQNGMYGLQHPPHSQQCHKWVQGLPNLLRNLGYFTGIVGKFHVGPDASFQFQRLMLNTKQRDVAFMAQQAKDFIKESDKKPFFLVVGYQDPHRAKEGFGNEVFAKDPKEVKVDPKKVVVPYHLPDNDEVRKDLAEFYQSIQRMDRGVGMLLEVLRELGQLDDTLIIFISDNGIPFPGAKTTLYNAGIHLPMIVAGPGVPAGKTNNGLVSFIDIAPTILDFTKADGPKYKLPGRSLMPIVNDDNPKGWDTVFGSHQMHEITMMYPMRTIVTPKYKLIANLDHAKEYPQASDLWGSPSWQSIRKTKGTMLGQRSVAAFLNRPREELYDLTTDPNELKNLASDPVHAKALTELRQRLRDWQQATADPWAILYREEAPPAKK
ncbi:MAG: sulfatase [Planctomycetes bacterium]|nr:sulfatase [Planctomycetota bacterium]